MKIFTVWFVCLVICFNCLYGQSTIIKGKAEAYKGKKITLYAKRDFLSEKLEKITSTIVSEDSGSFVFPLGIDSVGMFVVKSQGVSSSFYLQPNKTYDVIFPDLPPDQPRIINGTNRVYLLFSNLDSLDINYLLSEFNILYEDHFYDNLRFLQSKIFLTHIDSFKREMKKKYKEVNNFFFKTYVNYAIGSAELLKYEAGGGRRKLDIFNEYLRNKPILYSNNEYIRFVNSFFKDYIYSYNHTKKSNNIFDAINIARSPALLSDIFKEDDFLKDKELREFVVIHSLSSVFGRKGYENDCILTILDSVAKRSIFKNNSMLASNLIDELTHLNIGYEAPDFLFTDSKGNLKSLSDLKGKYVYLNFWASWCKECITELSILPEIYKKYKKDIEIISVCIDEDPEKMNLVLKDRKGFKWTLFHSPVYSELYEAYNVRSVPSYYLIDNEGKMMQFPAYGPSPNGSGHTIEETFNAIYRKLHPKGRGWRVGGKN